jgi:hypothetical protein
MCDAVFSVEVFIAHDRANLEGVFQMRFLTVSICALLLSLSASIRADCNECDYDCPCDDYFVDEGTLPSEWGCVPW